ncbi:MAG: sigma-70 family RNA polymerase sigma factor [Oscillospiraceae bacterium]|nr:sigma-70 family RNA polymerase sigma factor [Oscillospiraceae bacterium]
MDDAEIVRLFLRRSERALQETRNKYESLCMTVAYNMLGSREDAEECFYDALMCLWNAIPPAEPKSLGAYLVTAVRNAARDKLAYNSAKRRGGGQLDLAIDELANCIPAADHPDQMLDSIALRDAFRRFLTTLKPSARAVFLQRYWICLSINEIAAQTGYSVSRVNMSLMRTRKKLKEFLEKEELL